MKYSEAELRGKLMREVIGETVLHYSLVKKEGKNLSFLTNERLLIYDNHRRILYYNNDFKNAPFKTAIPEPKNQLSTPITTSTFANPIATNNILVRHTGKNQKGELQTIEWNFTCDTKQLANEWMTLLEEQKNKIIQSNTGVKNAGFVHDTLLEAVKNSSPPKETILKPEQQIIKPQETSEIKNSKITDPKRSQIQPNLTGSQINNNQPNMTNSQNNPNNSNIRQTNNQNNLAQSNLTSSHNNLNPQSIIQHTELQPINQSKSYINPNQNPKQYQPEVLPNPSSSIKPNNNNSQKQNSVDWNFKFLKNSTEATLFQFEQAAMSAWMAVWSNDCESLENPRRYYQSQGLRIAVSNCFSKQASQLKRQFRNYHFILEACKNKLVLGVPLCVLVQLQGTVALIKAPLPANSQQMPLTRAAPQVRELERYTRVSNAILQKATLLDVTQIYGMNENKRLVYVDNLIQYLPIPSEEQLHGASLRPQYLLESVGQVVAGGETKNNSRQQQKGLTTVCAGLSASIKELGAYLNEQETLWVDALELKEIFHSFGVNLKLLPRVYETIQNKQVRRCMQSVMAAKVAKDILTETLLMSRIQSKVSEARVVEDYLRLLMQGNNSNSSQVWKELNLRFRKQFSAPITNTQLIPGFFLNSLVKLLRIRPDISKLNKAKKPFREEGVIGQGFVVSLLPKIKSYYRFSTEFIQKVRYACREQRKSDDIHDQIVKELQLTSKSIPPQYQLNNNSQAISEYLAYYTPPSDLDGNAPLQHLQLYSSVLSQPPSAFSLRITKNYLEWAVKKERGEEFKRTVEGALRVCQYWLEEGHLHQADLVQLLSDFYGSQGNAEESVNFMKETLSRTIRNCGAHSRQAGARYYQLGERELKAGRKREALDSFAKAKANLEAHQSTSMKYPLLLMRTASLHLNNGSIDACLEGALDAIKHFDDYDRRSGTTSLTEGYKVKTFEVLARAYEITGRRPELKSMAGLCAKKFNRSQMQWTFEQMVRICLAASIFTHSTPQCQQFLDLCLKLGQEGHQLQPQEALRQMMALSESIVVMDKFLIKFDNLERVINERNSKKPLSQDTRDFLLITRLVTSTVGQDYIEGLIQQKQYE